jgi:hypothetical protein
MHILVSMLHASLTYSTMYPAFIEKHTQHASRPSLVYHTTTMSFEIELNMITIAALYWETVASFNRLFDHFKGSQDPPDMLPDNFGQLKV